MKEPCIETSNVKILYRSLLVGYACTHTHHNTSYIMDGTIHIVNVSHPFTHSRIDTIYAIHTITLIHVKFNRKLKFSVISPKLKRQTSPTLKFNECLKQYASLAKRYMRRTKGISKIKLLYPFSSNVQCVYAFKLCCWVNVWAHVVY